MKVLPDAELFTPLKGDGVGPTDYMKEADDARDTSSIAILNSQIARMGAKFQLDFYGPGRRGDKEVALRNYLAKQKLRVPINPSNRSFYGAGPITEDVVNGLLKEWNFHPEHIQVSVRKQNTRFGWGCYAIVTFAVVDR